MKKILLISLFILIGSGYYAYQRGLLDNYLTPTVKQKLEQIDPRMTTTLYKWRDKKGQWQVSDTPPPPGTEYETLNYNKNTNVIPKEQLLKNP